MKASRAMARGVLPALVILGFGGFGLPAAAAGPAFISGTVFDDLDRDGSQDPGEPGLAGVVVTIDSGADGSIDDQEITDGSGGYTANVISPGTYRVRAVPPAGFVQTSANPPDASPGDLETVDADFAFAELLSVLEIPVLGAWGMTAFAMALAAAAGVTWRRRERAAPRGRSPR